MLWWTVGCQSHQPLTHQHGRGAKKAHRTADVGLFGAFFGAKVPVHLLKITVMVLRDSRVWLANYVSVDKSSAVAWTLAKSLVKRSMFSQKVTKITPPKKLGKAARPGPTSGRKTEERRRQRNLVQTFSGGGARSSENTTHLRKEEKKNCKSRLHGTKLSSPCSKSCRKLSSARKRRV